MSSEPKGAGIIRIDPWLQSPAGHYLLAWEQAQLDRLVADVFGFHAVQIGWPALDGLRSNRMPHRWLLCDEHTPAMPGQASGVGMVSGRPHVLADFEALPFPANSLDLVVLPHTLELSADPHHTLREVERVLMPEGRAIMLGFNPASLWGLRQRLGRTFLPHDNELLGRGRLRDWLRLLGFEIDGGRFGCYRPPLHSVKWLNRFEWMDPAGDRWWPVLGSAYCLTAVKRVRSMRMIGKPKRKRMPAMPAPAIAAPTVHHRSSSEHPHRKT